MKSPNHLTRRRALALGSATIGASFLPGRLTAQTRMKIVATTGMIADTTARIGGAHVEVRGLMGPGVDPHAYRQTRSDIVALTRADLVFWHGLYLEAQMEDFFHSLAERREVMAVAEAVPPEFLLSHDTYTDKVDPHVWMNPELWTNVAKTIAMGLSTARPGASEEFAANLGAFLIELEALSAYAEEATASVPKGARVLVTAHDAFAYFGKAYDFEVLGIQGISTDSEAGLNRISNLSDMLVQRKIAAVFVESSVSDRNIRALIEGAAAQGHEVSIGGELFSDAMGEPDTYEGTYIGMIDHNITTIARALGGQVPEHGMSGKLKVRENQ